MESYSFTKKNEYTIIILTTHEKGNTGSTVKYHFHNTPDFDGNVAQLRVTYVRC